MAKTKRKVKKKNLKRKRIISGVLIALFVIIVGSLFYINSNFNKLISSKIYTLYNQSEAAYYYDLHFDKLRVNLINMSVRVYGVRLRPLKDQNVLFFEKNGSVDITIGKIILKDADIIEFLSSNSISIDEFLIKDSKISIFENSDNFQPFAFIKHEDKQDSLEISIAIQNINIKKAELIYYKNNTNRADNSFDNFNLKINKLSLIKNKSFAFSFDKLIASLNDISYRTKKGAYVSMKQFEVGVSSFQSKNKNGVFSFGFSDFNILISQSQFITADSVYTISAANIKIDKANKELLIDQAQLHPNLSKRKFTHHFKYQKLWSELQIEHIKLTKIDFNSIVDNKGVFSDSLIIKGVKANLYKSKKKPINQKRHPNYLAKQILELKYPIMINTVSVAGLDIDFSVLQENGHLSSIGINDLNGFLYNVQNKSVRQKLTLKAKGKIEHSIPFSVQLVFDYSRNFFKYKGQVYKSRLKKISKSINSFVPVEVNDGEIRSMKFHGYINTKQSTGTMQFLYRDLDIKIKTEKQNKQNRFLSLAANTYIYSNNPVNSDMPARTVSFITPRDRNKGFINILVKSVLDGVKETIIPSSDNRKRYKEDKRKRKKSKP